MTIPPFLLDRFIRRKAKFSSVDVDQFDIRIARTQQEYEHAFRLLHIGYVFQGYEPVGNLDLRMTEQHMLQEATVLVAYEKDALVGTVSLTQDSLAGLPLEKDYPAEILRLRRQGCRLAEVNSLAVVRNRWKTGLAQLLGLATARLAYHLLGSTHQVIGVSPKAAPFYRAMFGFEQVGPVRKHADLDADVCGLVQDRNRAVHHVRKHFTQPMSGMHVADYVFRDETPRGLSMPNDITHLDWPRWKMPRAVFRELLISRDRLGGLSENAQLLIRSQRSDETLGMKRKDAAA